jgi:ABC-2 type transport system ATP-binding protein
MHTRGWKTPLQVTSNSAIHVRGLVKRFGQVTALDGLDLEVRTGECFGLLGPNGAGKTTAVEILEGLQRPDHGTVQVLGMDWIHHAQELRERVAVQLQESQLYERLSVQETLGLFRSFYRQPLSVGSAIAAVGLEEKTNTWVGRLSGGQRQRLAVATCLVADPSIFFFDEPTTGLDPTARRGLWEVLNGIRARGRTILLTTHYMDEAERLCDRVAIVNRGKVIALGSPAQLIASVGGDQVIEIATKPPLAPTDLVTVPALVDARQSANELRVTVKELHVALPALLELVRQRDARVQHLVTRHATLEDVFLNLTGSKLIDAAETPASGGVAL